MNDDNVERAHMAGESERDHLLAERAREALLDESRDALVDHYALRATA